MHARRLTSLSALVLLLGGCGRKDAALDRPELRPPIPVEELRFSDAGTHLAGADWWSGFESAELSALVEQGLSDNLSVQAAFSRLEAAQAQVVQARAPLFPTVTGSAGGSQSPGGTPSLSAGVGVAYELDLWGRIRAETRVADHERQSTEADAQAAALSLSGEIARTWVSIAATRAQLSLLQEQQQANAGMTRIVRARFHNGVAREADALRQERLEVGTAEQSIAQQEALELLEHQLAVLLGRSPTEPPAVEIQALPALPPLPDAGIPVELIRRRPDVLSAEQALLAADAQVAVAITEQFPRLSFSLDLGSVGSTPEDLLTGWLTSLGVSLVAPILEGRSRRAEVHRSRAELDAAIADYGQALLVALQEVEDALAQDRLQAQRVENLTQQVLLAERTAEGLQAQYTGGLDVSYLDVLTGQTTAQQLRRDLIDARERQLLLRIQLYLALAGPVPREAARTPDSQEVGR
ncbi:MAG: efflux transporter outer membrane subunit [Myxococcota bacterium]|nr:efflux transporter outer membrane subunit [Myxococcota bacterium]